MRRIISYYWFFHRYVGHRIFLLGLLSLVTTLTEGFGVAVFISFLQDLARRSGEVSPIVERIREFLSSIGLPGTNGWIIVAMVSVFAIRGGMILVSNSYHFRLYMELTRKLTAHVVDAMMAMDYTKYLGRNTGWFTHNSTKEVARAQTAYYQLSALIPKTVAILTYLTLSFRLEWRFTLLSMFFGVGVALIFRKVNRKIRESSHALSDAESKVTSLIIQMLQSFKYLFSTRSEGPLRGKVGDEVVAMASHGSRMGLLAAVLPASSETIIVAFLGATVWAHVEIFGGDLSTLFVAMMFLYRVMRESTIAQGTWQALNTYSAGVDRLQEVFRELGDGARRTGGATASRLEPAFSVKGVSYSYGDRQAIRDVSFEIPARTTVAFVGESGSGKSTMVDLLTGLLSPQKGEIQFGGAPLRQLDLDSFRTRVGYVTQEGVMFDDTVANNVSLWQWKQKGDGETRVSDALRRANCDFVFGMSDGIQTEIGDRGLRVSGGQRQRLAIAREFYKEPAVLFLDEATSALDSESEKLIQESVDTARGRATIVMIAHRLSTIRNCDKIFVFSEGRLVEQGSFTELVSRPGQFQRMAQLQGLNQ